MDQTVYICTGGCGAVISDENYRGGLTVCGTEGCTHHGMPFEERVKCGQCGEIYKKDETHKH